MTNYWIGKQTIMGGERVHTVFSFHSSCSYYWLLLPLRFFKAKVKRRGFSISTTVDIERLRDVYREAKQNPADEITFKWLRMNMWVSSTTAWVSDAIYMRGNQEIDMDSLEGRECYAGLDLFSAEEMGGQSTSGNAL